MVLEAIMLCVDNSEWSRNGDYAPSRFDSQQDAAIILCQAKTQMNPENTLGVMAYAGRRVDVKITQTNDEGQLLNAINNIEIKGECDIITAIKVASLSLKNRQNKNQRPRIIIFVGHPIKDEEEKFQELGVFLKRSNVAIDVINFAHRENISKLTLLVEAANTSGNCHFLDVPLGVAMITDLLISSPIINSEEADGAGNAAGAGVGASNVQPQFSEFGGVDPNLDPELAMALRISLEEERARQNPVGPEMSVQSEEQKEGQQVQPSQERKPEDQQMHEADEDVEMDEEEILKQAMLLSMQEPGQQKQEAKQESNYSEFLDNDFVGQIVKDLNLDVNEQDIDKLLQQVQKKDDKKEDKKKEEEKKD